MSTECIASECLLAYGAGQLCPKERERIEAHLEVCEECCVQLSHIVDQDQSRASSQILFNPRTIANRSLIDSAHPAYAFYSRNHTAGCGPLPPAAIGRYQIEKMLGFGGFGVVYLATDDKLGRQVAIKVPHARLTVQPEHLDLILREAKTVANLDHPNIVPIYDIGSSKEFPVYLVTKLIDGPHLGGCVAQGVTAAQAVQWCIQIADALAYAHSQGIIHRDVKPQNILVDMQGQVRLTDFGLAKRIADEFNLNPRAGTPAYMSPEQLAGDQMVDLRADVYALGRVLTELLQSSIDTGSSNAHEPDAMSGLEAAGLSELAAIGQRACAKNPDERFQSASEFAEALFNYAHRLGWLPTSSSFGRSSRLAPSAAQKAATKKAAVRWIGFASLLIIGWLVYSWRAGAQASLERTQISKFLSSPSNVTYAQLNNLSPAGVARLWELADSGSTHEQLSAKLVLMKSEPTLGRDLIPAILTEDQQLSELLLMAYAERQPEFRQSALTALHDGQLSIERRLQIASLLAQHFSDDDLWLARENVLTVCQTWTDAEPNTQRMHQVGLRPVLRHLAATMRELALQTPDRQSQAAERYLTSWAELVAGDLELQVNCLTECPIELANRYLDQLKTHSELKDQLRRVINDTVAITEYGRGSTMPRSRCMAAYLLLQLGEPQAFWELARHRQSPDLESSFVQFCDESTHTLTLLAEKLLESNWLEPVVASPHHSEELLFSQELSTRRLVTQALFSSSKWTFLQRDPFDKIIAKLRILTSVDADPGMQAVASRIAKGIMPVEQWPQSPWLNRDASTRLESERSWSTNSLNMVLVHIEIPKGCNHSYCLSQCEVDAHLFEQFLQEDGYRWATPAGVEAGDNLGRWIRPQPFVSWFDCAAFCNWLSRREGLEECYEPNSENRFDPGMRIKPQALSLNGYRLPTCEEWEIGCRAGTNTPYATGQQLLGLYGWTPRSAPHLQPVGISAPNAFGLFDMHGNVSEWTLFDPKQERLDQPVNDSAMSACRGGDFASDPSHAVCDRLEMHLLSERKATIGFRLARTLTRESK